MLYPNTLEQKLGFDKIRELLKQACISPLGQDYVDKIRFTDNHPLIDKLLKQTSEFKQIVEYETEFPQSNYIDVREQLTKARIEGMALTEEDFFELKLALKTVQACLTFLAKREDNAYPFLNELAGPVALDQNLLASLDRIIDDRGHVRDSASPELSRIRKQIISEQANLRKQLDSILRQARQNGWIPDDLGLTVRGGRLVIPIAAEHKRKIKGFVHDESNTGQTVYLEPAEVFDSNNEIRELEYAERREIHRILLALTDQLRPHLEGLKRAVNFLAQIDFIRAKARFAIQIEAGMPIVHNRPLVDWTNTRHPLLHLSFQKPEAKAEGKKVVPLSVRLDDKPGTPAERILIISGPNAGGKSIALKTIGLVQYMLQCGMLVPMVEYSEMGVFQNLFIDIGDEQSLENDLSTYSSHLTAMKQFLVGANKRSLFLIDEFGTGTEPGLGGAIAEAILEDLNKSGAYGVINTHYTNLKVFADKTAGLVNGAMRFDGEHLEPLYQLEIGRPGSSFAFEIAQKIGLPRSVIERAKEKLGTQQVNFEKLIKELDIEKKVFAEKNIEIGINSRKAAQQLAEYTALKTKLDNNQKQLLNEAKQKAKALVQEANQRIENTIREIRETKADKEMTREIRQELQQFEQKVLKPEVIVEPVKPKEKEEFESDNSAIDVGSFVRIQGQTAVGQVLAMRGKDAEISIGDLKSTIKLNRLEKVSKKVFKEAVGETEKPRMKGVDMNEKMMNFSFNLDIRGLRGDEAITEVDQFFDNALMLGYPELRIVHGKGDGILRNLVRTHLRRYKQVGRMADEHVERGGAGVTVVTMK